jgi:aspartate-semialdehyde dehydrogenase
MGLKVGILGVGPVGEHLVRVLKERNFPVDGLPVIMATREQEEILDGTPVHVQKVSEDLLRKLDLVFFAGKEGAKGASLEWADIAVKNGCVVIDNGGDLRMLPNIPLVIPEINMDAVTKDTRLICNPNCSTIQMAIALYPLHKVSRLRRVVVSTYQSVSGHSGAAMELLKAELRQALSGELIQKDSALFVHSVAFNCIPHIDRFEKNGYTREEMKMVNETRKIFGEPNLLINATTVRVPVLVGHSESVNAEFMEPMHAEKAIEILSNPVLSPGVVCIDGLSADKNAVEVRNDPLERRYPVASDLKKDEWKDAVLVGRIRDDMTTPNAINLWCVSDNLRKGAATNAIQIAEEMLKRGLL